jgi:hypothetical protein
MLQSRHIRTGKKIGDRRPMRYADVKRDLLHALGLALGFSFGV